MNRILTGAVDIGGTKISVGIVDGAGNLLTEKCFPSDCARQSAQQAMDKVIGLLKEQCQEQKLRLTDLRGIGVACSGPVN